MRFFSVVRVQENNGQVPSERLMTEMGKLQKKLVTAGYRGSEALAIFIGIRLGVAGSIALSVLMVPVPSTLARRSIADFSSVLSASSVDCRKAPERARRRPDIPRAGAGAARRPGQAGARPPSLPPLAG